MHRLRAGGRLLYGYARAYLNNTLGFVGPFQRLAISVTGRCNSRCITCNIWRTRPGPGEEMRLEDIERVARSRLYGGADAVVVTGGEPFLRDDIADVLDVLSRSPRAEISVVTNGLLPERVLSTAREVRRRGGRIDKVALSLNGNAGTHDAIRGVRGGYDRLMESAWGLRQLGFRASFIFTVTAENHGQILWARDLSEKMGMDINFYPEVLSPRFENRGDGRALSEAQKREALKSLAEVFSGRRFFYFDDSTLYFTEKAFRGETVGRCHAGFQSAYVDWRGKVFACEALNGGGPSMGDIREKAFDEIWTSPEAGRVREYVRSGACQPCHLACEVVPSLRKEPFKVLSYAIRRRMNGGCNG
ncbi:MAG: radical SAM protein [Nitrospirota bacterium]